MPPKLPRTFLLAGLSLGTPWAQAETPPTLSTVEVRAEVENLEGLASAASEGVVSAARLATVPLLRPAETLELVPGLIATQHAGDGKANQYFLRGFNLDHGTDFATHVAGMPVNMPTHAHGQGYTDLNFLIPELVSRVRYFKGPYSAAEGDFSSAGGAHLDYYRALPQSLASVSAGPHGYGRSLLAGTPGEGPGLYALEWFHNNGPWAVPEQYHKLNGVLRMGQGSEAAGWTLTAMAYQGRWTSTDQVAQRALTQGLVNRYGSLDPTTGGETHRYSLAGGWSDLADGVRQKTTVWLLQSRLSLYSNFQYCLKDYDRNGNCNQGDQFLQQERRQAAGFQWVRESSQTWDGREVTHSIGLQGRADRLAPVGLYDSRQQSVTATVREDRVRQRSLGLWGQQEIRWQPWLRSLHGARVDSYHFEVDASLSANSGHASSTLATPKLSLILGPWQGTELYLNYGHGFHSNDARGTTLTVDPANPANPAQRVSPLVRTRGQEIGLRATPTPGWQTTLALWQLDLASELLFVGDAGTTEPARPSRRQGIEWHNVYALPRHLTLDADLAWSRARFQEAAPEGQHVPGAAGFTGNLGLTRSDHGPWSWSLRLRYVGPRPLIEDNSVRSRASLLTNARLSYRWSPSTQLHLDGFNLANRQVNDIEYWYESRLRGEAAAQFDRHLHPVEPRSFRLSLVHHF